MNQLLAKLAGNELSGFILVLARVTPLFIVAPLFSSAMIPPRVRGLIAVGISIGLTPVALHGQHVPADAVSLGALVIEGLLVGLGFALSLAVLIAAIESARSSLRRRTLRRLRTIRALCSSDCRCRTAGSTAS